jgi:hypothetical protein
MPRGLKATSSVVSIGASVTETAPGIYTQTTVDLNLDPLNNEVFVVLSCNIDTGRPEAINATNTNVLSQVTTTSQTSMVTIADNNCLARLTLSIDAYAASGVGFSSQALETPPSTLDYIGIIATNDFHLAIQGTNNVGAKAAAVKMYGYRAKAESSIYAALVQSEVLSA